MYRLPLLTLLAICPLAVAQTVPPEYQDLYTSLNTQISSFDSAVRAGWNGSTSPVIYAPQLEAACAAQYTQLVDPNYYTNVVLPQLEELRALGAQGIKLQVSFPILYQPFYGSNQSLYQSIAGFYQQLATDIHARGLKVIVEPTAANQYPGDYAADFTTYYQTLSWEDYITGRAQNTLNVAQLMHPDFMSLITEPDSEAAYTGQTNAGTVTGSTQLLQLQLTTLQNAGFTDISLGAGAGTWLPSLSDYIQSYAATSVHYIDMHVFPLNKNYMMNALTVASIAHASGKSVAISQLWDFKLRDSEVGTLTLTQTSGRDPFSFWQPVDIAFFEAMSDFSNAEQVLFIAPFWSHYFFAYLDYGTYGTTPVGPLVNTSNAASMNAVLTGASSPTGQTWLSLSIPQRDTTPPVSPAPPAAVVYATSVMLTWSETNDNVGVAAYRVYRNGSLVTTTSLLSYSDEGLSPGASYIYTLTAVDASGNVSPASAQLKVQTTTTIPPTVPALFKAQAVSISQVNLSWNASISSIGVSGYEIYRGFSAASLAPFTKTHATSYSDLQVGPSLTYYYAILAYDSHGNKSSLTALLAVKTTVEAPPSTPGLPVVLPLAYNQVGLTWQPSTSSLSIGGYLVYRGTSPSTLTQISSTYIPAAVDVYASPATTYFYAVAAYDINGLQSGQSPSVSVTTPKEPAPSAPLQFAGRAAAYNQVNLSWSASSSMAGVGGYVIYRGTSPSTMSAVAQAKTLNYSDTTVIPSTTYYYAACAYDTYGLYSPQSGAIVVATPQQPAPSAPTHLSAAALAYNNVTLSWTASTSPVGLWGYAIYRGPSTSTLSVIGSSQTTAYSDTTAAPSTTYYYAVAANDTYGLASAQSALASAATPKESAPSTPSHVTALASAYNNVALSWTASTSPVGLWGYAIYRGTSPASLSSIGSSQTTSYGDITAKPSTAYYYAIVANDTYGLASAQSALASAATPKESAPSTPSHVTALASAYNNVALSWTASTSPVGLWGYAIYRGTSPSSLSIIGSSPTTAYGDTTAAPSTTYYYAVAANDTYGLASAQSALASAATPKESAPSTPSHVTALASAYNNVALSWTASTSPVGLWGYAIYRGPSTSTLSVIGSSPTTAYSDTTAAPSTTYYYAVVANDTYGLASAQSALASAATPKESAPSTPSHVTALASAYNNVALSWTASTSPVGLWGYGIYRGTSPASLSIIGSSPTTAYSDTTAAPSTTYYYAVVANDTYGLASAQSPIASAVTPKEGVPSVPSALTAHAVASNQVTLSWNASSSGAGIGGYVVSRGTSPASLNEIGNSKTTSYSDTTVHASTTYYYSVAAYDIYGVLSAQSSVVSVGVP